MKLNEWWWLKLACDLFVCLAFVSRMVVYNQGRRNKIFRGNPRGAIGGKTGKTAVFPGFCKIECGGSSDASPCYRGLIWLGHVRHGVAPLKSIASFLPLQKFKM